MRKSQSLSGLMVAVCLAFTSMAGSDVVRAGTAEFLEAAGYAREMPPGAPMGAAYLRLRNLTGNEQMLEKIELPAHPAARVELHTTLQQDGVSRMRALKNLSLPGSGTLEMRPGATHLMVHGVRLKAGDRLAVKLVFADGSSHQLALPVLGLNDELPTGMGGAAKDENHHHHGDQHHHHSGHQQDHG